jgi:hypothetical protein
MNMLKFSFSRRCASVATVSKTIDDLPEPETPVKIVIPRLGMRSRDILKIIIARTAHFDVAERRIHARFIPYSAPAWRVPDVCAGCYCAGAGVIALVRSFATSWWSCCKASINAVLPSRRLAFASALASNSAFTTSG